MVAVVLLRLANDLMRDTLEEDNGGWPFFSFPVGVGETLSSSNSLG